MASRDDDDDDRPRRKRRPDPEDEADDDRPRRRRPVDDDDEAPPPRRPRRPADEIEEEGRGPRRRRPTMDDDEDEDRPRRRRVIDEQDDDDYEDRQRRRRGRASPSGLVTMIGIFNLVLAALILLVSIGFMFAGPMLMGMLMGTAEQVLDAQKLDPLNPENAEMRRQQENMLRGATAFGAVFFIMVGSCFLIFGALPLMLAGIGVLQRRQWGRILTLVLAGLDLLNALSALRSDSVVFASIWFVLHMGYVVAAFVILLQPRYAEEFS